MFVCASSILFIRLCNVIGINIYLCTEIALRKGTKYKYMSTSFPFFFMYVLLFKVAFMSDATLRRGSKSEVTWRYSSVHPLLRLPWHGSATTHVALLLLRYAQCDLFGPKYDMCLCFDSGSICVLVLRRCMAVCSWVCKCVKEAWVLYLFMSQWYDDQRLIPYQSGYILWRCM